MIFASYRPLRVLWLQAEMIQELVDDAVANGARLLNGGKLNTQGACARGQFFEPTILADVTQDMRIVKEEVCVCAVCVLCVCGVLAILLML